MAFNYDTCCTGPFFVAGYALLKSIIMLRFDVCCVFAQVFLRTVLRLNLYGHTHKATQPFGAVNSQRVRYQ